MGIFIKKNGVASSRYHFLAVTSCGQSGLLPVLLSPSLCCYCILTPFDGFAHFRVAVVNVQGSHDELMARKKVYFDLLSSQGQLNDTGSAAPSRMSAANTGVNTGSNTPRPE